MSLNSANLLEVIILAAGKGTRMYSSTPKVLHRIGGQPLLGHVINAATQLGAYKIHVVIGFGAKLGHPNRTIGHGSRSGPSPP